MGDKLNKILEGHKPIPMKRMFYPRGMKLSEDFVNAFHREYDRLVGEGVNPKSLVERFGKAMRFHQNEDRRYIKLDEEKAKLAAEAALPSHGKRSLEAQKDQKDKKAGEKADAGAEANTTSGARKRNGKWGFPGKTPEGVALESKKKKKKSRKKGGTYGMGDSHADSDGGDD